MGRVGIERVFVRMRCCCRGKKKLKQAPLSMGVLKHTPVEIKAADEQKYGSHKPASALDRFEVAGVLNVFRPRILLDPQCHP
jgi:hypothetical protein